MGFLRLPAELRNRIYEYAVLSSEELPLEAAYVERRGLATRTFGAISRSQLIPPPIAQTCRQIRNESLPIFFGQNNFVAYIDEIELWSGFLALTPARGVPYVHQSHVLAMHQRSNGVGPMMRLNNLRSWLQAIGRQEAKLILNFCIKLPLVGPVGIPRKVSPRRENGMRRMLRLLGLRRMGISAKRYQVEAGRQINGENWRNIADQRGDFQYDVENVEYERMKV